MLQLAVNLYKLSGAGYHFRKSQVASVMRSLAMSKKAVARQRDVGAWSINEMLKFQSFCAGLRRLFRDGEA